MKNFLTFCLCLLASSTISFAQVQVSSGNSSIDVKVKRAVAQGDDVFIDLIITSNGSQSIFQYFGDPVTVYDDEGNMYMGENGQWVKVKIDFEFDGKQSRSFRFPIERGIPRKMRVFVRGVDEYASAFTIVKIPYMGDNSGFTGTITIKNLPITR